MRVLPLLASFVLLLGCPAAPAADAAPPAGAEAAAPASAAATPALSAPAEPPERAPLVAFGDVHGDLAATRKALELAGVVDADGAWVGGRTTVVQVGDQTDRGDGERAILDWFDRLRDEAEAAGGAFVALLGNHEVMNAQGDYRYVTPGGWAAFADVPHDAADPALVEVPPPARGRVAAFRPGGPYARMLAEQPIVHREGRTLFVHGGLQPAHVAYGLDRLNAEAATWLRGEGPLPPLLGQRENPLWMRHYSDDPDAADCELLRETLAAADADRIVVAHTVQPAIAPACGGAVWRVDVGMAAHYGGTPAVLVFDGGEPQVRR